MELPQFRLPNLSDTAERSSKLAGDGLESLTDTVSGRLDALSGRLDALGTRLALADRIDAFRNPRRDEGPNALTGVALLGGLGIGMAVMYFLDPQQGARRRELLASRVLRIGRDAGEAVQGRARDLSNRGRGAAAGGQDVAGSPAENTLVDETPYVAPALDDTDAAAGRPGGPGEQRGGGAGGTTAGGYGGGYGGYGGGAGGSTGGYGGESTAGYDTTPLEQPTSGDTTGDAGGGTADTTSGTSGTSGLVSDPAFGEIDPKVLDAGGGSAGTPPETSEWSSTRSESRGSTSTEWGSSGTSTTSDAEPSWRPSDAGSDRESSGIQGGGSTESDESSRRS